MMFASRRKFLLLAGLAGFSFGWPKDWRAHSDDRTAPIATDYKKVAIRGYDTVAYFTEGKPTKGSPDHEFLWQGARWRFASAAHRDMFARQPESYAPRFGGYCVMAMTSGAAVRADPEAWVIVDGRLYLNGDKGGLAEFQEDTAGNIEKAQERWNALGQ